jgi:hypothetical protein
LYVRSHPVTFIEAFESGHVDGGVVNTEVATVFPFNESESLLNKWIFPSERNEPTNKVSLH